ncbi:hypothetical protein GOAMR_52_00250 [Gordonia amarae NBRC 15530]|uniref:Integral membrane protein n=2 Tax=Gordonia amarae TaxID=36821 RepID=G7GS64_9ACTN|nr:hypothetical protein GOAMR_52_00250 [Gordonia amarae NBRC 15530]
MVGMHSESTERSQRTPVGLITAGVVFAIGIVAVVVLFLTPVVADGSTAPTFVYLLTMCAPLGFVLGLIFAFRSAREIR